ncbi:hypothetical protein, partial [Polyangium sorediatum]
MESDPAAENTGGLLSSPEPLWYKSVQFGKDDVAEVPEGQAKALMRIPRADIRSISLSWGNVSERLPIQICFGLVCIGIGAGCAWRLFEWLVYGGVIPYLLPTGCAFAGLGIYVLVSALRRGYFLRVQTEREVRKIVFAKGADPERIEWLLNEAKRTFVSARPTTSWSPRASRSLCPRRIWRTDGTEDGEAVGSAGRALEAQRPECGGVWREGRGRRAQ